jgi:chitin disaccharide deacetylase
MNEKQLIVNGDDLGMSRGITDAILIAHRHGFLTSASLMVNMPASQYAVQRLATALNLGVGVHLNICQGKPLLPPGSVRSLVDSCGAFLSPSLLIRRLWRWQVDEQELEAEFRAQIRWAIDRGVKLTHADSHRHMHIYPGAVRPFARALAAEGIHKTRAPRCSHWPKENGEIGGPHAGSIVRRVLVQSYRSAVQAVAFRRIMAPDSRVSFPARESSDLGSIGERWKNTFTSLPAGSFEFACHPGIPEPGFSETDPISAQRERELHCLMDPEMRDVIARNGIRLITYRDLSQRHAAQRSAMEAAAL